MEVLTNDNLPRFVARLRSLLSDRTFTFYESRGEILTNMRLASVPIIATWANDLLYTEVNMGGVAQPFTSYFATPDGPPLIEDAQTCRIKFGFTDRTLFTEVEYLAPQLQGHTALVIFKA